MVLTDTGLAKVFQRIKSFVASQLNSKASAIHTHTSSDITDLPSGYIPISGTNALSGSIVPSTDNSYDFGSSSYKLRYVYCNTAYVTNLNINGSPAGDILTHNASEFVDVSGNQTVAGKKIFSNGLFASVNAAGDLATLEDSSINSTNEDANGMPLSGHTNVLKFKGSQVNVIPCVLAGQVFTSGNTSAELRTYKYKDTSKRAGLNVYYTYANDRAEAQFINCHIATNDNGLYDIGSYARKFRTAYINAINGIAPDNLGLPTSAYTDVASYIINFDYTANTFTAPVSGLLYFDGSGGDVIVENATCGYLANFNRNPQFGSSKAVMYVNKGDNINVYTDCTLLSHARIHHLKGKI